MKISTRSRYGLRFMIELAEYHETAPVPLAKVAKEQNISAKYLGQIAIKLRQSGLIFSTQGALGGYSLARSPGKISALNIIEVFEPVKNPVPCLSTSGRCKRFKCCRGRSFWAKVGDDLGKTMNSITLQDIIDEKV